MKYSKLLFLVPAITLLAGCGEPTAASFKLLDEDEVLVVGDGHRFRNNTSSLTTDQVIEVPNGNTNYVLQRTYFQNDPEYVYYDGYYYYLTSSGVSGTKTVKLGKKTVETTETYGYMPYGKDDYCVVVQTTTTVKTTYTYESHWEYYTANVTIDFSSYFETEAEFKEALPTLAAKIEEGKSGKVYVDAVSREITTSKTQSYETYYYIEEAKEIK